jgi:hypothetical protein
MTGRESLEGVDVVLRTKSGHTRNARMSIERLEISDRACLLAIIHEIGSERQG